MYLFLLGVIVTLFIQFIFCKRKPITMLPNPIFNLPMEKSFELTRLSKEVDKANVEQLRSLCKGLLHQNMVKEVNLANLVKHYPNGLNQ